jgi:hypothetical protein
VGPLEIATVNPNCTIRNETSGWVEIRHWFHPLREQRFRVLKRGDGSGKRNVE